MSQLHNNLNHNDGVDAVEIKSDKFFDFDKILDRFYKRPESGSVNRTHIFSMYEDQPGILELKDSTYSDVRIQNLTKGNWSPADRKKLIIKTLTEMQPMTPPGIKPIKQIELGTKWRPLVPEEFQDDVCKIPPRELVKKYKKDKRSSNTVNTSNQNGEKSPLEKMKVPELRDALKKLKLPSSGNKPVLVQRLQKALDEQNQTQRKCNNSKKDALPVCV